MNKILIAALSLAVASCSGMSVNTNLGPYASSRVKTALVAEYSLEEIAKYDATSLGFVEAAYCQERPYDTKPSRASLLNDLKVKTHTLGGNGVVVETCEKSAYGTCHAFMECRGLAYSVPNQRSMP